MTKIIAGLVIFIYSLSKLDSDFKTMSTSGSFFSEGALYFHLLLMSLAVYILYNASKYIVTRANVIKDVIKEASFSDRINVGNIARKYNISEKRYGEIIKYAKNKGLFLEALNEVNRVFTSDAKSKSLRKRLLMAELEAAVINYRNAAILGSAIILYPLLLKYGIESYSVMLGCISFIFSVLYHFIFEQNETNLEKITRDDYLKTEEMQRLISERTDKLTPVIKRIFTSLDDIKKIDASKYCIVSERMCDIIEFERVIPILVRSYRNAQDFIGNREDVTNSEIIQLNAKLSKTINEAAKENIKMAVTQKNEILDEVLMMQKKMEECESTLDFILSSLQKIEIIIQSALVSNNLSSGQTEKLKEQFDVFSNTVRSVSNIIKL